MLSYLTLITTLKPPDYMYTVGLVSPNKKLGSRLELANSTKVIYECDTYIEAKEFIVTAAKILGLDWYEY